MKKTVAILLSALLLLSAATALGEGGKVVLGRSSTPHMARAVLP